MNVVATTRQERQEQEVTWMLISGRFVELTICQDNMSMLAILECPPNEFRD